MRVATPIDESEIPFWRDLPAGVRTALETANITQACFDGELGRRRGDVLNFYAALGEHDLWSVIFIEVPRDEMGYNGLQFLPRPDAAALVRKLAENPKFTNLSTTWRGKYNRRIHPETYNFSENGPPTASLHFTFNDTGPGSVHFDYYNAHCRHLGAILGHAFLEYPLKRFREFSNAKDIQLCLNARLGRNVWRFDAE